MCTPSAIAANSSAPASADWRTGGAVTAIKDQGQTYIHDIGGVETEAAYPYTATDGTCAFDKSKIAGTLSSCQDVSSGGEGALQNAIVQVAPMAVAIGASHMSFQLYQDGVYYEPNCSSQFLDHGVTAIGYGSDSGSDYFLVKNSWGTGWGSAGYIKMARNRQNNCGIATQASYP